MDIYLNISLYIGIFTKRAVSGAGRWLKLLVIITLDVIIPLMIKSFADKDTERLYITGKSKRFDIAVCKTGLRKLDYLNSAHNLNDLKVPPGNKLEALKGKDKGKYSIRVNDQYRVVFRFEGSDAYEVEITDYH